LLKNKREKVWSRDVIEGEFYCVQKRQCYPIESLNNKKSLDSDIGLNKGTPLLDNRLDDAIPFLPDIPTVINTRENKYFLVQLAT